jgi:rsbT co-antagonist protein RsbR
MSISTTPTLGTLLQGLQPAILADWHTRLLAAGGNYARGLTPRTELDAEMRELLASLVAALDAGDDARELAPQHPLAQALRAASNLRAARGFSADESLRYLQTCKQSLVAALAGLPDSQAAAARVESLLDRCVGLLFGAYVAAREDLIRRQGESLREVSTPVITLWDSMLLLPLVGIVDSVRAQQISETLLEAISRSEAEVTLIDVTGVPVMDTSVARHILKTVAAAEMLGTRVILTGIGPSTAQTMVKLGIDMSGVPTRASLKSGLALALTLTRRAIVPVGNGNGNGAEHA